jgi:hypothetical protein
VYAVCVSLFQLSHFSPKQLGRHVCPIIAHHNSFDNSAPLVRVIVKVSAFSRHVRSRLVARARARRFLVVRRRMNPPEPLPTNARTTLHGLSTETWTAPHRELKRQIGIHHLPDHCESPSVSVQRGDSHASTLDDQHADGSIPVSGNVAMDDPHAETMT